MLGLSRKRLANGILAIGVSILLLYLTFRKVDFATTFELLRQVDLFYVLLSTCSLMLVQVVRTFRWHILVRSFAKLSTLGLFRVANLGIALVFLLPFRLGEFARPYLLKTEAKVPMSAGFGASAVERTIDGLVIVFIYFLTTMNLPANYPVNPFMKYSALVAGGIFSSALVVIILALFSHARLIRLIDRVGTPFSAKLTNVAIDLINGFVDGLKSLPNLSSLAALFASTGIYFSLTSLSFYGVMCAFGWDLPLISAITLMCVVNLGIMIPAGPGFLGTYQAAIAIGLNTFGVGLTESAAYGLVIYFISVVVVVGFGLPFLFGAQRPSLSGLFANHSKDPTEDQNSVV